MSDWKARLRDADRGAESVLSDQDRHRIRRAVVAAATEVPRRRPAAWPRAFVITASALVLLCASVLTGLQQATRHRDIPAGGALSPAPDPADPNRPGGERQQLQFRTPGGTRIIWVFDSEFEQKGTLP